MKPIYALSNVLDKHPNIISGAVMSWVNLAIIAEWVKIDGKTASALNLALAATLALFVASKTSNTAVLNELAQDPPTVDGVALDPAAEPPVKAARARKKEDGQITPERALSIAILAAVALVIVIVLLRLVLG